MTSPVEFRWNARAARYIRSNGNFVAWADVREGLERVLTSYAKDVRRWGTMSLEEWRNMMQDTVRNVHLMSRATARGGWASLGQADLDEVSQSILQEAGFLDRLAWKIASGEQPLDGNFRQYSEMYAWAGLESFYEAMSDSMDAAGFTEERNVITPGENCDGCLAETARGWVPIGTLKPIGQRTCRRNCRCKKEFRRRIAAP
jgi:hypothetical protein